MAVDGWAVTFGTATRGLVYNDPLLCGFNVPLKRVKRW